MARRNEISMRSLVAHPLTIAILIYAALVMMNAGFGAKLFLLEPIAWASEDAQIEEKPDDLEENESLAWDLRVTQEKNALLAKENQLLREAMGQVSDYIGTYGDDMPEPIPARILLRAGDSSPWRQGLYLKAGAEQGIEVGFPVCQGRTLVGVVTEVSANISVVSLITDSNSNIPVSILPAGPRNPRIPSTEKLDLGEHPKKAPIYESTTRGIVRGSGSIELQSTRLPLDDVAVGETVAQGMVVVTNDASGAFPEGLLVGYVASVQNQNTFLSIQVDLAMDLRLNDVLLVIPHHRPTLSEGTRMMAGSRHLEPKKKRGS